MYEWLPNKLWTGSTGPDVSNDTKNICTSRPTHTWVDIPPGFIYYIHVFYVKRYLNFIIATSGYHEIVNGKWWDEASCYKCNDL